MSNLRRTRTAAALGRHPWLNPACASPRIWTTACLAALLAAGAARAEDNPFEAFARMVVSPPPAAYRGPIVAFPESEARPQSQAWLLCSERFPVCVHAPQAAPRRRVERALRALDFAYAWLAREGWPLPYPDGGLGGSTDFDLYLGSGLERPASAAADLPVLWSPLDATTSYAQIDVSTPESALDRCALFALSEAALLGQDPAETDGVRHASAAFATWLATGDFGCDDNVIETQRTPELGPVGDADPHPATLALWLALIAQRHDGGDGRFIRELWELARQHSERPNALHVSPSFFQALGAALEKAGESLDQSAVELALARYFAGSAAAADQAPSLLPRPAAVPFTLAPTLAALPKRLAACEPPLAIYGSAYVRVPTPGAREGTRLQAWLRGEPGARWSLLAVRLDAQGRELSRMEAPPRRVPESYLPIELTADTTAVLLIVTRLAWERPDERAEDDRRCFRLILDAAGR